MKVKTLSALAGLGGALIMSSASNAAYLGTELVDVTNWWSTVGPAASRANFLAAGGANNYTVYRLFAKFDAAGNPNRVNAIAGNEINPWFFTLSSGTVHNLVNDPGGKYEQHFNLAPSAPGTNPDENSQRGWETWATIRTQNTASTVAWTPGAELAVNNFQGNYYTENAALYVDPDNAQGAAIALSSATAAGQGTNGFGVLLLQITVNNNGFAPAQFSGGLGLNVNGTDVEVLYSNIPAPGALALLGLAGLVGSRRRRG